MSYECVSSALEARQDEKLGGLERDTPPPSPLPFKAPQ
jgi:hypothetical protein